MESRVRKCYIDDVCDNVTSLKTTRSSRNAKLYQDIYRKCDDFDNLPIENNINEIDIEKLKELVLNSKSLKEDKQIKENLNILEQKKRQIDEQKVYDINKILEKAKYENSKLKMSVSDTPKKRKDLLATLRSTELSLDEINEAKKKYQMHAEEMENSKNKELSMTRELRYKDLNLEKTNEEDVKDKKIFDTNDLSLDLFDELKPSGNTITTKPIVSDLNNDFVKNDIRSGDTSDIDIIKDEQGVMQNDFFTNSYEFSKKDFADVEDEDFFDEPKSGGLFKILLLFLAIFMFVGVILYFVWTYGLGIS